MLHSARQDRGVFIESETSSLETVPLTRFNSDWRFKRRQRFRNQKNL